MLSHRSRCWPRTARGMTFIETLIAMAIMAVLMALAAPNFGLWLQNSQLRTAADATLAGLQLARATAVQRNDVVSFYPTSSLDNSCAVSVTGAHWVVSMDDPSGACATTVSTVTAPRIVQTRSGNEGSRNAVLNADQAGIGFNGLGRRVNAGVSTNVNIDITNPTGGTCVAAGGEMRCLRVMVSLTGQIRLCDPATSRPDARAC